MTSQSSSPAEISPRTRPDGFESVKTPLSGVNPRSLDALMAEDVAKLSDGEFDQICLELRRQRAVWEQNEAGKARQEAAGQAAKAAGAKRAPRPKGTVDISLEDIL